MNDEHLIEAAKTFLKNPAPSYKIEAFDVKSLKNDIVEYNKLKDTLTQEEKIKKATSIRERLEFLGNKIVGLQESLDKDLEYTDAETASAPTPVPPSPPPVEINFESKREKKTAVFQFVALAAVFIALYTPRILITLPCLIIVVSAIVSMVRREPRWGLSLCFIFLGFYFLNISSIDLDRPSTSRSAKGLEADNYKDKLQIVTWNWVDEGDWTYIRGRVKNIGDKTVRYYEIKAFPSSMRKCTTWDGGILSGNGEPLQAIVFGRT